MSSTSDTEINSPGDNQNKEKRTDDAAKSFVDAFQKIVRGISRLEQGRGDKNLKGRSPHPDNDGDQMKPVIQDSEEVHVLRSNVRDEK